MLKFWEIGEKRLRIPAQNLLVGDVIQRGVTTGEWKVAEVFERDGNVYAGVMREYCEPRYRLLFVQLATFETVAVRRSTDSLFARVLGCLVLLMGLAFAFYLRAM